MAFQLLQNQASGHIKIKQGTGHVFYLATPSHTNESAHEILQKQFKISFQNSLSTNVNPMDTLRKKKTVQNSMCASKEEQLVYLVHLV